MEKEQLLYAYCITNSSNKRVDMKGIDNKTVFVLPYQKVAAIVSKVDFKDFNKKTLIANLKKTKWAEEKVRRHAEVTQKIMEKQTVLPLKFGTIFKDETGIKRMLRASQAKFFKLLTKFKDKAEWGVKIYADSKKFKRYIEKNDAEIKQIQKKAKTSSMGRRYLLGKKLQEKLEQKASEAVNQSATEIFATLSSESEDSRLNKNLPPSLSGKDKDMILNSVFLIEQGSLAKLKGSLNKLLKKYNRFELQGELSGPWPAYNFL